MLSELSSSVQKSSATLGQKIGLKIRFVSFTKPQGAHTVDIKQTASNMFNFLFNNPTLLLRLARR